MPASYYGGEEKKKQEINKFIMDYDSRKIDTIAKYTSISQATFEAGNVIEYNKKNSNNYKWVIDKMEILWTDVITKDVEYVGYIVSNEGFKEVFRFEADGFIVEGKDRLLVDNPMGQGAGMQCYYTLKDGYYSFYEIKKDYTAITLDNI